MDTTLTFRVAPSMSFSLALSPPTCSLNRPSLWPSSTIQNDLFDLGADLCIPDRDKNADSLKIVISYVKNLEKEIDLINSELTPLRSFILPGGTKISAYIHIARTIARRCEREMIELRQIEESEISKEAVQYINRLSDFLFVAARYANLKSDFDDILWVPGNNYEE